MPDIPHPNGFGSDQPDVHASFAAMMQGFSDSSPEMAVAPPTIEEQRRMLAGLQRAHHEAWRAEGIMQVVADMLPESFIDAGTTLELRQVRRRGTGLWEQYIAAQHPGSNQLQVIGVSLRQDDMIDPQPGFTLDQARLVNRQLDELNELRKQGTLPHLSADGARIDDPSTAMTLLPKQSHRTNPS